MFFIIRRWKKQKPWCRLLPTIYRLTRSAELRCPWNNFCRPETRSSCTKEAIGHYNWRE